MGKATVLCHTFEHDGGWFCFDTVTGQVYECDEVAAEIAPVWNQLGDENVRRTFDEKWGREQVQTTLEEIQKLNAAEQALTPKDLTIVHECSCCSSDNRYESEIEHMQMTLSEQCNLRCEYCPYTNNKIGMRVHNDTHMSRETALAAIDFFMARNKDTQIPIISFYGGEPLLQFDLIKDIVAHLRTLQGDRVVQLHVDTNGALINEEIAAFLIKEEFYIQISLDGPKHIHDRYRKTRSGEGSHDQVIAGLERLLNLDPACHERIRFNAVMAPPHQIKEVLEYFTEFPPYRKLGISTQPTAGLQFAELSEIDFQPREITEGSEQKANEEYTAIRDQYLEGCLTGRHDDLPINLRSMFDKEITQYNTRSRELLPDEFFPTGCCRPGQKKLHIKADGSFMPCERCGDNMLIGHLDTGFDMEMIHRLFEKLITAVAPRCRECWSIRQCGLCFVHMTDTWKTDGTGEIFIPEEVCQQTRDATEQTLRHYLTLKNGGPEGLAWLEKIRLV